MRWLSLGIIGAAAGVATARPPQPQQPVSDLESLLRLKSVRNHDTDTDESPDKHTRKLTGSSSWYFPGGDTTHYFMVNPITLPSSYTIEAWINPTVISTNTYWLSLATTATQNCMYISTNMLTINTWNHLIVTWDGTTNSLYVNGATSTVTSGVNAVCVAASGSLVFGQEQDVVGGNFQSNQAANMYLDTVAIYDTAWTSAEIPAKNARDCVDFSDSTLYSAWFDGPVDRTGNGRTATIVASTTSAGSYGYCPTPEPTTTPTVSPTPLPSKATAAPSSVPSPVPTVYCRSGTYYDGVQCVPCDIGHFSQNNNGTAPWPHNCSLCPAGQFNTLVGSPSCEACDIGKLSVPARTFCKDCQAGEYSYNDEECRSCDLGKYAPQPQTGGCIYCASGSHTNNATAATTCTPCNSGKYSPLGGVVECSLCLKGSFSASGQSGCTTCTAGSFAADEGEDSCQACAAGRVTLLDGASDCEDCDPGSHQPSTGQTVCVLCSTGKFSSKAGALSCSSCTAAYSSRPGSTRCDIANVNYFLSPSKLNDAGFTESVACPKEATCAGALRAPVPRKGHWADRGSYKFVDDIYECPRNTCKGANSTVCWDREAYASGEDIGGRCDVDQLQCEVGALGPLCGSCGPGFIYRSESKSCGPCEDAKAVTFVAGGIAASAAAIALLVIFGVLPAYPKFRKTTVFKFFSSFDTGSLKVIWVTYQIIMSTSFNLDITFPPPFNELLGILAIFSLDFLALECFQEDVANRLFTTVYLWATIPIIFAAMIFIAGGIRVGIHRSWNFELSDDGGPEQAKIMSQHVWALLLLSYLVLPPVTSKLLVSLDCIPFNHDGSSFLRVDTGIDCNDPSYESFRGVVIFFLVMYQAIPMVWMALLFKLRDQLNPSTSGNDRRLALHVRDHNPNLDSLRFLFNDYRSNKWWFEVAEMYRRIAFVGILPLTSPLSATRASLGCVLAIASIAYYREEKPYRVPFTNFIAHMAQFVILLTFYAALSIDTGVMVDFGLKDLGMGIFLVIINLAIMLLTLWLGLVRFKRHSTKEQLLRAKANTIESAGGFNADKFSSTFDAISQTSMSNAHVLVFHYTTLKLAKLGRESGIPALEKHGGVALTLRHPHSLTDSERKVFADETATLSAGHAVSQDIPGCPFEAVLAIALPKRMLDPLPGFESDPCLCLISASVLYAMRPTSFVAVLQMAPWLSGLVLLPPSCLIRSYLLLAEDQDRRDEEETDLHRKRNYPASWIRESDSMSLSQQVTLVRPETASDYLVNMKRIRKRADEMDVVPLYHFTNPNVVSMILDGGIRMSTQGQGDGGCYFSTLGPASLKLGKSHYEVNIIRECFGIHRIEEYTGQGKLNAVIVYGCCPAMLSRAPGGRDNARMVTRSSLEDLSFPHSDGSYFLRPKMILGAILIECDRPPFVGKMGAEDLEGEALRDQIVVQELESYERKMQANKTRIDEALKTHSVSEDSSSRSHALSMVGKVRFFNDTSHSSFNVEVNSESSQTTAAAAKEKAQPMKAHGDVELMPLMSGNPAGDSSSSEAAKSSEIQPAVAAISNDDDDDGGGGGGGHGDDEWEELQDESTRKSYFWNRASGETRWDAPAVETRGSTVIVETKSPPPEDEEAQSQPSRGGKDSKNGASEENEAFVEEMTRFSVI